MASSELSNDKELAEQPMKVFNWNRKIRKLIGVNSFADLLNKCRERFSHAEDTNLRIVLADDGVEVEQDSFHFIPANANIMLLTNEEEWAPALPTYSLTESNGPSSTSELLGYIETLQEKCTKKRKGSNALGSTAAPKYQIPDTVRISPGWKQFSYSKQQYIQVRSRRGMALPTGDMIMKSNMDYQTCLTTMENLYFPNGMSINGRLASMETKLGNNKGEVPSEHFSPYQAARSAGTQKLKLYLLTKKKISQLFVETESESEEEERSKPRQFSIHAHQQNHIQSPQQVTMFSNLHNTSAIGQNTGYISPQAASSSSFVSSPAATSGSFESPPGAPRGTFVVHAGTPTVQMQLPNALKRCVVCADREVDTILSPCIHTLRFVCAQHLYINEEPCPMCRGPIEEVKEIQYG